MSRLACWLGDRKIRGALAGSVAVAVTAVASAAMAAGGHGEHHAINWWSPDPEAPPLGWFIVNFVVFFGGLVFFARKPIRAAFLQRHETIKQQIQEATEAFDSATERYEGYQIKLANVDDEAAQFVARGREDGQTEGERALAAGREYSERLRADSETIVVQEYEGARARLRRDAVAGVMRAAERILREQMTDADRDRLVEEAIAELERDTNPAPKARRKTVNKRPRAGGAA
jgi:F0F1-type ATP synthase membrane subunit b/b'